MNDKNVFISYGHHIYDDVVKQFADDLRQMGFNVFLDTDFIKEGDWEQIIDDHIIDSKYFLFLVSARSVSPQGYCLNELCRAGESNSVIIPIKLDDSLIPLGINKYQRYSLMDCLSPDGKLIEPQYSDFLKEMQTVLNGNYNKGFSDKERRLETCLKPISSRNNTFTYYNSFCGREAAFYEFEKFVESNKNIWWLNARPGMGKTAFTSMLVWRYPQYVKAIHFCQFNNSDRVNPKNIISSIAYQLACSLPAYKDKLLQLFDLESLFDKSAARIFEYLLIEPMQGIKQDEPVVVVIDALDEASVRGENEMCKVFTDMHRRMPSWLKFAVSSRNEAEIRRALLPISKEYVLSDETSNDLREYYKEQFPEASEDKIELLLTKSEGSFLYASEITKQIKDDHRSLDDIDFFPVGIYGYFNDCFSRIFGQNRMEYESVRPLLEFLCISQEPTDMNFLENYLNWSEYELKQKLAYLSGLFPIRNNYIEPLHKSLIDWLTNKDDIAQVFFISKRTGYHRLLEFIQKDYDARRYDNKYVIKYYDATLIELEMYQKLAESLDNYEFQRYVIDKMDFDFGLGRYLAELEELNAKLPNECVKLLVRPTFIRIFSENRRLLYNSGMFFNLKRCGLSVALRNDTSNWGIEGEIGKVFYYYIVEDFNRAIRKAKSLLADNTQLNDNDYLKSELYNVKGLSERKLVLFDDAMDSFDKSIEFVEKVIEADIIPPNGDPEFEKGLSYLIKGKIYLHMQDFYNANHSIRTAIKTLNRKIEEMPQNDKKISNILFLAEDYRVFADAYVWQCNYDMAEEYLTKCAEVYEQNQSRVDRYYIRYKYTTAFLRIMRDGETAHEEIKEYLLLLLKSEAVSNYDKGQIYFYLALNALKNGAEADWLSGIKWAQQGADAYDAIDAYLEMAECNLLHRLLSAKSNARVMSDEDDNPYIINWIQYVSNFVQNGGQQ